MKRKFLLAFTISLIIFTLGFITFYDSIFITKNIEPVGNIKPSDIQNENPNKDKPYKKKQISFLLFGVDEFDLTDTMMVFNIDFDNGNTSLISMPRDTKVMISGNTVKLNSAYKKGDVELILDSTSDILGINLEYYVKVDYQIVMDLVEDIGGVKIDVPFLMEYNDPTANPPRNRYIEKGEQVLDGKNAHDFLRWRKNNNLTVTYPDGDLGRIKAQQYFMKELIKQTLQAKNIVKLPSIVNTYFNNVETNLPLEALLNGIKLAGNLDTEKIETNTLPGEDSYINDISYFIYDEDEVEILVDRLYK